MIARLLAAFSVIALAAAPAAADTLLDNVEGISINRDGVVTRFRAMLIREDGVILQIFKRGEKPPSKVDYRIDGRGRTVIPGLVDSHAHVVAMGFAAVALDLSDAASLAEAQAKIAAYSAKFPDRPWIVGEGWNEEKWGLGRFPTAAELDAVVADRPVWLVREGGTVGWANGRALEAAGIDAKTADPPGGRIERVAGTRAPAGVLVDGAMQLVRGKLPAPRAEDRDRAFLAAQDMLLRHGVTAVADMGTTIADWQSFRRAGDAGNLRIRVMAYAASVDDMALIGGPGPTPWLYDDRLRLNGLKLRIDGVLNSRSALLKQPYADDPRTSGIAALNPTQLRNLMSRAAMDGFQMAVHANGDASAAELLAAIEELGETYSGDRRWRVEHAQVIDPADFPRFGRYGIVASVQPLRQTSDRAIAEARLGLGRLAGAYAWRSIAQAGAPLAFGSDAPAGKFDPFAALAAAVSREDQNGQPFGGWQPQEALTREQALAASTAGGAYAGFGEGRFGRLAVGERADFVMLDEDPLLASAQDLRRLQVLGVWISGQQVYDPASRAAAPPPDYDDGEAFGR